MSEAPGAFKRFKASRPEMAAAYERLSELAMTGGPLSEREARLVKLGVALGVRSPGAIKSAMRKAGDAGLGHDELEHAVYLALANIGLSDTLTAVRYVEETLVPRPST